MRLRTLLSGALLAGAAMTWSTPAEAKFASNYNDPDLDWYTIETEHFAVHYPVSKVSAEEGNDHYINAEFSASSRSGSTSSSWTSRTGSTASRSPASTGSRSRRTPVATSTGCVVAESGSPTS